MIGWLDPSISSKNTGDLIIRDSVLEVLRQAGAEDDVIALPTQRRMTGDELKAASNCTRFFIGGTNLLSSNMPWYRQWKVGLRELRVLRNKVVLLGVGWWQYQGPPNAFTRWALNELLTRDIAHSVRDRWTGQQLARLGLESTFTACPTMWSLPACPETRSTRGQRVIITLTDYNRAPDEDRALVDFAHQTYDKLVFWPQGARDADYCRTIASDIEQLPVGLPALDEALSDSCIDFLGTRLHAGIRALQHGRRATIVAVDNRAQEISRDTNLPVIQRSLPAEARDLVCDQRSIHLTLPRDEIEQWRTAFSDWITRD
jgi:polysaccharide pyruvyl transferase WcaK-like protein